MRLRARTLFLLVALLHAALPASASGEELDWYGEDAAGAPVVELHFFTARGCPHCARARDFLEDFARQAPWLRIHEYELTGGDRNRELYARLAERVGGEARYVPAFFFCETSQVGFADTEPPGGELREALEACHRALVAGRRPAAPPGGDALTVPLLGRVDSRTSLPLFTLVIAGLDGFNPCAFFVLLVLLSLLVHSRSRGRIFLVGGIFVLFSGLFYLAFMAAWLNAFLLLGELALVTGAAGLLAVAMGAVNLKDFFRPGRGPSLSIPESARPGLFRRMRRLAAADRPAPVIAGTIVLAAAANSYELLCTAGFPLVFTRVLTLHELSTAERYLYLALYNALYVLPLAAVVVVFAVTLGSRKLSEAEGRALKLLSGLMLLGLGAVLVVAPALLQQPLVSVGLLGAAAAGTGALVALERRRRRLREG
jgi:glutaredoxin